MKQISFCFFLFLVFSYLYALNAGIHALFYVHRLVQTALLSILFMSKTVCFFWDLIYSTVLFLSQFLNLFTSSSSLPHFGRIHSIFLTSITPLPFGRTHRVFHRAVMTLDFNVIWDNFGDHCLMYRRYIWKNGNVGLFWSMWTRFWSLHRCFLFLRFCVFSFDIHSFPLWQSSLIISCSSCSHFLVDMSNIWLYVMSCVCLSIRLAILHPFWPSFKVTVVWKIENFGVHFLANLKIGLDEI